MIYDNSNLEALRVSLFLFRQHQKADRWTLADKIEPDQQVSEKQTIMGAHT